MSRNKLEYRFLDGDALEAANRPSTNRELKLYLVCRRIKNFVCAEAQLTTRAAIICLKHDPELVTLDGSFSRDVRRTGYWVTGDLEPASNSLGDLENSMPLNISNCEVVW